MTAMSSDLVDLKEPFLNPGSRTLPRVAGLKTFGQLSKSEGGPVAALQRHGGPSAPPLVSRR